MKTSSKSGFTFVEVCVVFTIIALLVAMIVPIFLPKAPQPPEPQKIDLNTNRAYDDRVTVTKISTFRDLDAYSNSRAVYLIRDNVTKKEFIGISGVGISELGSHSNGDDNVSDER